MDEHQHHHAPDSEEPAVDTSTGRIESHCSLCGASIEGSHEFCQACAIEAAGGEEEPAGADAP